MMTEDWAFEQNDSSDWIGVRVADGRRTQLKWSLQAARTDAEAERLVCRQWPRCEHRDADACTRATRAAERKTYGRAA